VTIRVRVITEAAPAIVLSYPREADPVFGAEFTEIAQLPPHFEQEFTVSPGIDLLVAEMPQDAALVGEAEDAAIMHVINAVESEAA
jgi:hypothetical protein